MWRALRSGAGQVRLRRRTLNLSVSALAVVSLPTLGLSGVLPAASANLTSTRNTAGSPPKLVRLSTTAEIAAVSPSVRGFT